MVWNLVLAADEGGKTTEVVTEVATKGGWFLEYAWVVPVIPAVCWALIILFGHRPGVRKVTNNGAYIGLAGVAAAFVVSLGVAYQWIQRVHDAGGGEGALGLANAVGRSMIPRAEEAKAVVTPVVHAYTWFEVGSFRITWGSAVDGLVAAMLVMVCIISLMVHIFSLEYVRGDERFTHYFSALSLFTAGMLNLVVAQSTLQLLLGWEIMGLCSFLLIGHWWEEKKNSDAALKAFFTTRTGDIGLLVGLSILFWLVGGFGITDTNLYALSDNANGTVLFWAALALLIAIIGKSGQFPLHTWLPDAMAGPTPVSALIHAATMVVAGVYLGARIYPVFYEGFNIGNGAINPMAVIGAITIVIAALLAFVQTDIKKVLAYSTVSQLGFMVMSLGVGGWIAAVFHIFTHAFFKALLFLGAGSVSHSGSHHSFDMREMGGLRKHMPITFVTFLIGTAALMGFFPLAGFWSKDEIIATAGNNGYTTFMIVGLVGAFLTAAYMTRCVYLVFFGEYRGPAHGVVHAVEIPDSIIHAQEEHELEHELAHAAHGHGHGHAQDAALDSGHAVHDDHGAHEGPHESPALITVPLIILAILSITAGWLNMPWDVLKFEKFLEWVEPTFAFPSLDHPEFSFALAGLSMGLVVLAIVSVSYLMTNDFAFFKGFTKRNKLALAGYTFLVNKYYLDALYEGVIVKGIKGPIAWAMNWVNQNVIDAVVNGAGTGAKAAGRFAYRYVDQDVIDGVANGAGTVSEGAGEALRPTQSGKVSQYGAFLFGFAAILTLALVISVT